ncbi:hypothetical protein J1N35_045444 [Gossypium stocksii]|uniref:Uncharacterized protein n=1 Tax=Gossypium stocksii TaxID=47602 RepID=A0A9D3UB88_9ROSI|nr:hypothetical protein J1N35_045444 [Gossypium stocksii]
MPELYSQARRNRASINANPTGRLPRPDSNKCTVRTRPWRTAQNRKTKDAFLAAVDGNKFNDNDNEHNNTVSGAGLKRCRLQGRKEGRRGY